MDQETARALLTELAAFFDYRLAESRMAYYLDALVEVDGARADEVFGYLIRRCSRFPSLKEVLDAFDALQSTTHEIERGRPVSSATSERLRAALVAYQQFEPVSHHADLYWGYIRALQEYQVGKRSQDDLRRLRQTLIEQARARDHAAQATPPRAPAPDAPARPTGVAAAMPRGDE